MSTQTEKFSAAFNVVDLQLEQLQKDLRTLQFETSALLEDLSGVPLDAAAIDKRDNAIRHGSNARNIAAVIDTLKKQLWRIGT